MTRLVTIALTSIFISAGAFADDVVSGPAEVIDGSTLKIQGETYRLADAVAPGRAQTCEKAGTSWPCGEAAMQTLSGLIAGRPVKCQTLGRDIDRRPLAVCYAGEEELNRDMIAAGMALVHWQVGLDYDEVQSIAKAARLGLWAASFEDPWDWRHKHAGPPVAPPS